MPVRVGVPVAHGVKVPTGEAELLAEALAVADLASVVERVPVANAEGLALKDCCPVALADTDAVPLSEAAGV